MLTVEWYDIIGVDAPSAGFAEPFASVESLDDWIALW